MGSIGDVLLLTEQNRDVTIIVVEEALQCKFPAHKLLLSSKSPVLRKYFDDTNANEVEFIEISALTTESLLSYIYKGTFQLEDWNDGISLLEAAHKYEIHDLVQRCGSFLESVISLSNVCYICEKAHIFSLHSLYDKSLSLILNAGFLTLETDAFLFLSKDCIVDIVSSDQLNIESELVVIRTLRRWAKIECCRNGMPTTEENIKSRIDPFLEYICFDDMSDAEKSELPTEILSCVKPNNQTRCEFHSAESLFSHACHLTIDMNENTFDVIGKNQCCIRFSVDAPIYLIGMNLMVIASILPDDLSLTLQKENVRRKDIFTENLMQASLTKHIFIGTQVWNDMYVKLKKPVMLRARDVYSISFVDSRGTAQTVSTTAKNTALRSSHGTVNFVFHEDSTWSVTKLIFV